VIIDDPPLLSRRRAIWIAIALVLIEIPIVKTLRNQAASEAHRADRTTTAPTQ
jgi:hypothetical protein